MNSESIMKPTWKKKASPEAVLSEIEASRTPNPNGQSYSLTGYEPLISSIILESMLHFPDHILRTEWPRIVFKALCTATAPLTKESFIKAAAQITSELSARPIEQYRVLTAISISPTALPHKFKWGECTIAVYASDYPKKFKQRADALNVLHKFVDDTPHSYSRLVISVSAKSAQQAVSKALINLNDFRAALNFYANYQFEYDGKPLHPVNRVRLGKAHTVHHPDGTAATEMYWYEQNFIADSALKGPDAKKIYECAKKMNSKLKGTSYAQELTKALSIFVRALDEADSNIAFLRLWSALESLLSSDQEALLQRCAFVEFAPDRSMLTLKHLQHFRNQVAHEGVETENSRREVYLLLYFFRKVIRFYLAHRRLFSSIEAANEFLDLPSNSAELNRKLRLLKRAIYYRSPAEQ
jgi:hypothetical protein